MRTADGTNWALSREQILDLASSLSDFFCHNNVNIKKEVEDVVFGGQPQSELHQSDQLSSTANYSSSERLLSGEDFSLELSEWLLCSSSNKHHYINTRVYLKYSEQN